MITLLHNNACSKSNCSLDYIKMFPHLKISTRAYLEDPLSKTELLELLSKMDNDIKSIVRYTDTEFINQYGTQSLTDEQYLEILVNQAQFLQRPILIDEDKVIVGRPPELILEYLKQKEA